MSKRTLVLSSSAATLALVLTSSAAWANRQQVFYNDLGRPFSADQTQDDFVRAIQQSLREYELHTQGAAIFEWGGVTTNPPCGGGANVRIQWDATLPSNICAQTNYYSPFAVCPTGTVSFNPMFAWRAKWNPNSTDVCVNFQATLNHELAHWMKQVGNDGHVNNSVLTQVGTARDLLSRHLWNSDMDGINFGDWFFRIIFPAHGFTWRMDNYNPFDGSSSVRGVGAGSPLGTWPTEAFAPGPGGQQFSAAWGSPANIQFTKGDGVTLPSTVTLTGTEMATRQRVCVATNTGNDVIVAWASANEVAPSGGGSVVDGGRGIFFAQSHNGGASFSAAQLIPFTLTRAGVSCSFDPVTNNAVIAYEGAGEEGIWLTRRSITSTVSGGWTTPSMLPSGRTAETPHISFDPFAGTQSGWLAWHDSITGVHSLRPIGWNGSAYALSGTVSTAVPSTQRLVRSPIVAHMANGTVHVATSHNDPGSTAQAHRRTRGFESGVTSTGETNESSPASDLLRYSSAAENTIFIHTVLGGHLLQGPN